MLELWYREDVIRILNAVAHAGELQGAEYHKAIRDVARAFGVHDELDLPAVEAGYRVNDGHHRD
jgi:hypothetical protein